MGPQFATTIKCQNLPEIICFVFALPLPINRNPVADMSLRTVRCCFGREASDVCLSVGFSDLIDDAGRDDDNNTSASTIITFGAYITRFRRVIVRCRLCAIRFVTSDITLFYILIVYPCAVLFSLFVCRALGVHEQSAIASRSHVDKKQAKSAFVFRTNLYTGRSFIF